MRKALILLFISATLNVNSQNLHAQTRSGQFPQSISTLTEQQFFTAVRTNAASTVENHLKMDRKVNTLDTQFPHNSALHWAAWENSTDVLSVLLKQKELDPDVLNGVNETPLMIAALKGRSAMVTQLLAAGAYPNKEGWTPLHYAATEGHIEIVKLLLDAHAYIDAESPNKTTPLMMAARSKNILLVKLLLDEGADVSLKNAEGWTAQTFAEMAKANDIAEGLQSRINKLNARNSMPNDTK